MNKTELMQVRDALSTNRVMAKDADGNYTREVTPKLITAAIALIDASLARVVEPANCPFGTVGCQCQVITPQAATQPIPKGYVKASEAIDVRTIHAQLHDIWSELNAVDTVLGDQNRLMTKVEKLRDACGSAVNCMIPLEAAAQPSQAVELSDAEIYKGWKHTFSTENPFCPCNLKSFTKSVNWAIAAINAKGTP